MDRIKQLIRPHIIDLKPYSSARDEYSGAEGIFLDANENALGSAADGPYNRYPDPYQKALKQKIAEIKQVSPRHIFLGNGSDEAIDLLVRVFCQPERDNVIILPPTYGMYEVCAHINNIEVKEAPLTDDFQIDEKAVLSGADKRAKIVFLCSPNNPTGNLLKEESVLNILQQFNGIVAVDEAYIDFAGKSSMLKYLHKYPNLVVFQTFSKAWGMAGLRLGAAFADPMIIGYMNKIKYPYNVNQTTQELALNALNAESKKEQMVREILKQRETLVQKLQEMEITEKIYPSDANFILAKFPEPQKVYAYLLDNKIIVRDRSRVALCEGCLRITVGSAEENEKLCQSLERYPVPQI